MIDEKVLSHILLACKHGKIRVECWTKREKLLHTASSSPNIKAEILEVKPGFVEMRPWCPGWGDLFVKTWREIEKLNEALFAALGGIFISGILEDEGVAKEQARLHAILEHAYAAICPETWPEVSKMVLDEIGDCENPYCITELEKENVQTNG